MDLQDILFVLVLAVISFLAWTYVRSRSSIQNRRNQIWREFARLKGLNELQRKGEGDHDVMIKFQGQNEGLAFVMECIMTEGTLLKVGSVDLSSGDGIKIFTRMQISLPGLPRGLLVYRETAWSKLGKAVGMQDINMNDPEFDSAFVAKGKDAREVTDYLTPSRRMVLLTQVRDMKGLVLQEQGLVLFRNGQIETMDELNTTFSELGSIATSLIRS